MAEDHPALGADHPHPATEPPAPATEPPAATDDHPALAADRAHHLAELLAGWLPDRRWFAGKGHRITAARLAEACPLPGPVDVLHLVVGVQLNGDRWQTYQVPVSLYDQPRPGLEPIGRLPWGTWVHDAVADPGAVRVLLEHVRTPGDVDPQSTHGARGAQDGPGADSGPPPELQAVNDPSTYRDLPARPMSVEQSNSSAVLGEVALVKVFRLLVPGVNPDVEVHAALGAAGCPHVGHCLGWINGGWRDPSDGRWVTGHLGMVQQLLSPAVDGWQLALKRVAAGRSLAEARALGEATGGVHLDLHRVLPNRVLTGAEVAGLADRLHGRLDRAAQQVPDIEPLAPALHARIDVVASTGRPIEVQRVHGDFHLGQVLLAADGWKLLDFEGEPGVPMDARSVPDHPLRDVAGMLRSFAYAAAQGGAGRPSDEVARWQADCAREFLAGYTATGAADPDADSAILAAYTVDKAAYEAVYESRNRPDWLGIPMSALRGLAQ